MVNRRPLPETQRHLTEALIKPETQQTSYTAPDFNRGYETAASSEDPSPLTVTLENLDTAVDYYFKNVIKPVVIQNGTTINVPIYYGSPERWTSIQKNGFLRDNSSKLLIPLIIFKRTGITRNRALSTKLDGNKVNNFYVVRKKYDKSNYYDNFSVLNNLQNRKPVEKVYVTAVPDFVTVTYECLLFTDFVHQMNKIVETINYVADAYWGEKEGMKFRASIDSFNQTTELQQGEDRAVRSSFNLSLNGYILPDAAIRDFSYNSIIYSPAQVLFTTETVADINSVSNSNSQ